MALPVYASSSAGVRGVSLVALSCFPSPPSPPVPFSSHSRPASAAPSPGPSDMWGLLWCCRGLATMWATPGGKLMIGDTMAQACSLGVPLPPNGGGTPTPTPVPPWPASLTPPPKAIQSEGGWGKLGGCPPPLLWSGGYSTLFLHVVYWERTLLGGFPLPGGLVSNPPYLYCMP